MYDQGRYVGVVLEDKKQIIAYATFICDRARSNVFLDYYAVDKNQRGSGIGSRFLKLLREYWKDKSGIILECEMPESAKTENEKMTRKRRIDFYLRGGAEITPVHWRLFGVDYNILWLQTGPASVKDNISDDLTTMYSFIFPRLLRLLFTQIKSYRV